MPMISGFTPATDHAVIRAVGVIPRRSAASGVVTIIVAAPSVMPDELPGWTVPSALNTGRSFARLSWRTPSRGCSSRSSVTGSFRPGTSTGNVSRSNRPSARARSQRCCVVTAHSSCSSRVMPCISTSVSAVRPMICCARGQRKPSRYMPSTTSALPSR